MIQRFVLYGSLCVLLLSTSAAFAQNFPFTQRKTWDGPYDIKMVAAPNLEPVFLNATLAPTGVLKADSIIRPSTIAMTGDLLAINNQYKDGSPFKQVDIPMQAFLCNDPEAGCIKGLTLNTPNSSCPVRYNSPTTISKFVSMNYADYDDDLTTYSSSMSKLDISKCSEIEAAYLYWTGNFKTNNPTITLSTPTSSYDGTGDVFNVSTTSGFEKVRFKVQGGNYQDVTATTQYASTRGYVCVADITTLIKGTGAGNFWVGNIQTYPNEGDGGSASGWTLVVIFRSPLSPPRLISLWDGFKNISQNNSENFLLTGLQAPATSDFQSFVGFAALDGENIAIELGNKTREGLGFQTNAGGAPFSINPFAVDQLPYKLWTKKGYPAKSDGSDNINSSCKIPLFDANWASVYDGISSSHITTYDPIKNTNGNEIVRLPSMKNTLGFDAHHMKLPEGAVAPGATEATLTVNAGPQGGTQPYMAYVAIERLQPKLVMSKSANKSSAGLDSIITYTLRVTNEGNDTSLVGDVVYDTLDVGTDYVASSLLSIPSGAAMMTDSINNQLKIVFTNRLLPKDSVDLVFKVKVKDYAGNLNLWNTLCKRSVTNIAYVEYATKTSGKIKSKSNSIDCGPSSEVKIILVDDKFKATPDSLGTFDATLFRTESIITHVYDELVKSGKVVLADVNKFEVRDSIFKLVLAQDVFPSSGKLVTYFAIQNNNSTGDCQKIYKIKFILGTPKIHVDTIYISNLCADYTISNSIITAGDTSSYGSKLVNPLQQEINVSTKKGGTLNIDPASNSYIYTPKAGFVGKDTAVIQLFEPVKSITVDKPIYITVNPVNHAPVVKNENFTTYRNQAITGFNLLSNDKDQNGDIIAAIPSSDDAFYHDKTFMLYKKQLDSLNNKVLKPYNKIIDSVRVKPKRGSLSVNSKGEFTYEPNLDEGKDTPVRDTAVFWVCDYSQKTYCNPFFCRLDTVVFEIKPYKIFIPEGFSPNGDGINDFFFIDAEVPLKAHIMVYNRWGSLVYENKEYKNDWDGKANKGVVMGDGVPDGTYYVYVNVNDKEVEQFRYITINR